MERERIRSELKALQQKAAEAAAKKGVPLPAHLMVGAAGSPGGGRAAGTRTRPTGHHGQVMAAERKVEAAADAVARAQAELDAVVDPPSSATTPSSPQPMPPASLPPSYPMAQPYSAYGAPSTPYGAASPASPYGATGVAQPYTGFATLPIIDPTQPPPSNAYGYNPAAPYSAYGAPAAPYGVPPSSSASQSITSAGNTPPASNAPYGSRFSLSIIYQPIASILIVL